MDKETLMTTITKVLVANRGEIACRIFRSLEQMGIPGVAVYHPADARSPALAMASETVEIDGPTPVASYRWRPILMCRE